MAAGGDEAEAKMAAGLKRANSSAGFFGRLFDPAEKKFEDAYELFSEAANLFKISKRFDKAAEAYKQAAAMQQKLGVHHEAATCYVNASNMLKKSDPKAAAEALTEVTALYQRMGKLTMAAKHSQSIAELYETQLMDMQAALKYYTEAAEFFEMEDSASSSNKAWAKVAHIMASLGEYDRATDLFEKVATQMAENPLLKYSAKEYFLKAGLCRMCTGDIAGARVKAEQYQDMAATFRDSREARFLMDLVTAHEANDADQFTTVLQNFDAVSPLDQWYTTTLLVIKKSLTQEDELQ